MVETLSGIQIHQMIMQRIDQRSHMRTTVVKVICLESIDSKDTKLNRYRYMFIRLKARFVPPFDAEPAKGLQQLRRTAVLVHTVSYDLS